MTRGRAVRDGLRRRPGRAAASTTTNGVVLDRAGRMWVVDTDDYVYVLDPIRAAHRPVRTRGRSRSRLHRAGLPVADRRRQALPARHRHTTGSSSSRSSAPLWPPPGGLRLPSGRLSRGRALSHRPGGSGAGAAWSGWRSQRTMERALGRYPVRSADHWAAESALGRRLVRLAECAQVESRLSRRFVRLLECAQVARALGRRFVRPAECPRARCVACIDRPSGRASGVNSLTGALQADTRQGSAMD